MLNWVKQTVLGRIDANNDNKFIHLSRESMVAFVNKHKKHVKEVNANKNGTYTVVMKEVK